MRYSDVGARVFVILGSNDAQGRPRAYYVSRDLREVEGETPDPIEAMILNMLAKQERMLGGIEFALRDIGRSHQISRLGGDD